MHWTKSLRISAIAAVVVAALFAPSAGAATVVNGNFESGSLAGWQVFNSTPKGNWYVLSAAQAAEATKASEEGESEFFGHFLPPSGNFGAYTEERNPDAAILYQDVTLEPFYTHQLSIRLGYFSFAPIVAPPTFATPGEGFENQQLRVDVMKPTAPIESLSSSDILATVFASKTGDPTVLPPQTFSADLTPFAGQTVRIRIANAVNDEEFNTSLDDVTITSTPPNNAITRGKLTLNKKKGTGKLAINVPGAGTLKAAGKGKRKLVKTQNLTATAAGVLKVALNPTAKGKKILKSKGKLKLQLEVTFTPTGGLANVQVYKVTLKKTLPAQR